MRVHTPAALHLPATKARLMYAATQRLAFFCRTSQLVLSAVSPSAPKPHVVPAATHILPTPASALSLPGVVACPR